MLKAMISTARRRSASAAARGHVVGGGSTGRRGGPAPPGGRHVEAHSRCPVVEPGRAAGRAARRARSTYRAEGGVPGTPRRRVGEDRSVNDAAVGNPQLDRLTSNEQHVAGGGLGPAAQAVRARRDRRPAAPGAAARRRAGLGATTCPASLTPIDQGELPEHSTPRRAARRHRLAGRGARHRADRRAPDGAARRSSTTCRRTSRRGAALAGRAPGAAGGAPRRRGAARRLARVARCGCGRTTTRRRCSPAPTWCRGWPTRWPRPSTD